MAPDAGSEGPDEARRLVLLRHAKSSWKDDVPDAERKLSSRGKRDALEVGHWFAEHVGRPDLVLCSTAVRTRLTWARACEAEPDVLAPAEVRFEPSVYEAWTDTLLDLARALPSEVRTAVLVAHGPGLPDLAERLNRGSGHGPVGDFPTSAVALFSVRGPWAELGPGTATLETYAVPRG